MILDIWCSFLVETDNALIYFKELLKSIKEQIEKPRAIIFAIHGSRYADALEILSKNKLGLVYVNVIDQKRFQWDGYKYILRVYKEKLSEPDIISTIDADDILLKIFVSSSLENYKSAESFGFKAVVRNILRFYKNNLQTLENKDDITDFYIPNAIEKDYIVKINDLYKVLYKVNQPFMVNEETSTIVVEYKVIKDYLLNKEKFQVREDVLFYEYLCKNSMIAYLPIIVSLYRQHEHQTTQLVESFKK